MYNSYEKLSADLKEKPANFWLKKGEEYALNLFHKAANNVPAYKDFLLKNAVDHEKIITIEDFKRYVPIIDKENYINKYEMKNLSWDGDIYNGSVISQSSGTTYEPHLWARSAKKDTDVELLHEVIFRDFYNTQKKNTLFIVCFYLGAHIAGMVTSNAIRDGLSKNMRGALVTAGINKKDIFNTIKKISPLFEQTVLIGYPPFLRDIVSEGKNLGIDWKKINLRFMYAAESFPENWREHLCKNAEVENYIESGLNVYGSSEIGFIAHETFMTIELRNFLESNLQFRKEFGLSNGYVPAIYQYHSWNKYFESVDNHLVCTSDNGLPLVRYDTKDIGLIYNVDKVINDFFDKNLPRVHWNLPILTVFGRSDYTATIYGLNVYPEHIKVVISSDDLINFVSDKFFMKTVFDDGEQFLEIHIELLPEISKQFCIDKNFENIFFNKLLSVNIEYHKLYDAVGEKVKPKMFFYENGSKDFYDLKAKNKYIIK